MSDQSYCPSWSAAADAGTIRAPLVDLGALFACGLSHDAQAPAIADRKTQFSFHDLEASARVIAIQLRDRFAVGPGDRVVVLARKLPLMAAVAVAIWKLGATYVPLDAELPAARLDGIMTRTGPRAVLHFGTGTNGNIPAFDLSDFVVPDVMPDDIEKVQFFPESIAYIIHTSGSTGAPKGVQITIQSLTDYFHAHNAMLRFDAQSRVMSLAPFHFDVSIEDTLLPLSVGAFVFQYNTTPAGVLMRKALAAHKITHLIAVSTLLTIMSDDPKAITRAAFPDLQMVMTGAELCAPTVINLWKLQLPDLRVYNVYGPTEVTIVCTGYEIEKAEPGRTQPYPIGTPLAGVSVLLLSADNQDIETPDVIGELCLGGSQVMAGYLNNPQATADRIFTRNGTRFYRSGDMCQRDSAGNLHFVGREDSEIKLNGRRILLGEIQSECQSLPGIRRAAAGLVPQAGTSLIGVVLVTDTMKTGDSIAAVRAHLDRVLPVYMRPAVWGLISDHALTGSGKTDDRALIARLQDAVAHASPGTQIFDLDMTKETV